MAINIRNNTQSLNALRHLSWTQSELAKSLEKLSSGQRINHGGDDPAGLIISENLRAQIASVEQAIKNSEISISVVQTAEGALSEVNNLLIEARQLSLAAANEASNDEVARASLQNQLRNALNTIERIANTTRFGNKFLLNGSNGVSGVASNQFVDFLGASEKTRSSPVEGYEINVTEIATRSEIAAPLDTEPEGLVLTLNEGGKSIRIIGQPGESPDLFVSRLTNMVERADLDLDVEYDGGTLFISHQKYGKDNAFSITVSEDTLGLAGGITEDINNGTDIQGTINGEIAVGKGRTLTGAEGNRFTDGLSVFVRDQVEGLNGTVSISQNSMQFQVGQNVDQRVGVALNSVSTSALGRGVQNDSQFSSLSDIEVDTVQNSSDAIRVIDKAITQVSKMRGELGATQKNALESNVAVLRITAENLLAAESTIRDADVVKTLSDITRHQIMTNAASAAAAQANQLSIPILNMLLPNI